MYHFGFGVQQSYRLALRYFKKAAKHHIPIAKRYIGNYYEKGYGVRKNLDEARKWYQQGATEGDTKSKYLLEKLPKM
jgi:TPR repeat protein